MRRSPSCRRLCAPRGPGRSTPCWSTGVDRFSRSLRDLTGLLDGLADAEVVFRSATEPFDTAAPVGRMLVQMLGVFAEFESS
jgi:DNA invertase Pin-like site-specific DNA recombinase